MSSQEFIIKRFLDLITLYPILFCVIYVLINMHNVGYVFEMLNMKTTLLATLPLLITSGFLLDIPAIFKNLNDYLNIDKLDNYYTLLNDAVYVYVPIILLIAKYIFKVEEDLFKIYGFIMVPYVIIQNGFKLYLESLDDTFANTKKNINIKKIKKVLRI